MSVHAKLSGSFFSSASAGQGTSGSGDVGFNQQGIQDPNAQSPLDKNDLAGDLKAWDPRMAGPQEPVVSVAAVLVGSLKPSSLPAAGLESAAPAPQARIGDKPVPTVDTLDAVKKGGEVDNHLGQKAEKLKNVAGAQNDRMAELKANMDSITKPVGAGAAQLGANSPSQPSALRSALGLVVPSPTGLAMAAAATYTMGPVAGAAVAAADTALNVMNVFKSTTPAADVALKGQGTYSDAKTETRLPQYGSNGKPRTIEAFTYGTSSAKPIEQIARPASAPIIVDPGLAQGTRRLSADDLWKTGQLADTGIKLGPQSTKDAADQMAQLRTEMEKTGVYVDKLKRFAETPLDLNRDTVTQAMGAGTNVKTDDLENRMVLQVRPPHMNVSLRLG